MNSYIEYKKNNRRRKAFSHSLPYSTINAVTAGIYDIKQFLKIKAGFNAFFLLFILILLFITILHI